MQNPEIADDTALFQSVLSRVTAAPTMAAVAPAAAGPMANEFEQEGQLEIAQVLMDLQNFKVKPDIGVPDRQLSEKNKRAGKRTKRRRTKRKTRRK